MDALTFNSQRYSTFGANVEHEIRVRKLVALVGQGKKVLDLGCLDGAIGQLLIRNGNCVWGIDASQAAVPLAREKGVDAQVGDLEKSIDLPDGSFDVVLAAEILEHILNLDGLLEEIRRVLVPDGHLVVSTPNLAALGRRLLLLCNRNPHIEVSFAGGAAGHVRYFIRDTLFALLREHRFEIEEFTSDEINLNAAGTLRLVGLATLCPTLGRSLIARVRRA